jgi:sugar lactone lactonase YvrE
VRSRVAALAAFGAIYLAGCKGDTEPARAFVPPPGAHDSVAPQLQVLTPSSHWCSRASDLAISGRATDNIGVSRVTVRFDTAAEKEVQITAGTSVAFSAAITLPSGPMTLIVTAYDTAGNQSRYFASVRYSVSRLIAARLGLTPPNPIIVVDSDGDCRRDIAITDDYATWFPAAAWNPNQTTLVFQTGDVPGPHLYVTALDGKVTRLLPGQFDAETSPQFTLDGQWLYFSAGYEPQQVTGQGLFGVWRMHPDGSGLEEVSPRDGLTSYLSPSPSPDGTRVVLVDADGIAILDVASRTIRPLGFRGKVPRWSPAGDKIAFIDLEPRNDGLGVVTIVNTDGTGRRAISAAGVAYTTSLSWSHDGTSVLVANFTSARLEAINVATGAIAPIGNSASLFGAEW